MRRLWILMATVLAFGGIALLAPAAEASVGRAATPSPKFCAAATKIGTGSGSSDSPTAIAKYANQFKEAGKSAPKNVKNAANTIQKVLSQVKNIAKNPTDLAKFYTTNDFKNYGKAVSTFFLYAENCSATTTTSG